MARGHQVERVIGERQWRLVPRRDDHRAQRMQALRGQGGVGRPRLDGRHGGQEGGGAGEHLAASGVNVQRGRHARQPLPQQALVAPRRAFSVARPSSHEKSQPSTGAASASAIRSSNVRRMSAC